MTKNTLEINEHIEDLKKDKSNSENLRLMTPVQHPDKLPLRFRRASIACNKAWDAYAKAYANSTKALDAYAKARKAYIKALRIQQLEKLHKKEHPNCP